MLENRLLLYVSGQPPSESWQQLARVFNWEILHENDLMDALAAYVMLMPAIVVIDHTSPAGMSALAHLNEVFDSSPHPLMLVIELGIPHTITRRQSLIRIGMPHNTSPNQIIHQLMTTPAALSERGA